MADCECCWQELHAFQDVYLISALRQKGLEELRSSLIHRAKPGTWKLDAAEYTDQWPEDLALEVWAFSDPARDIDLPYLLPLPFTCTLSFHLYVCITPHFTHADVVHGCRSWLC